MASARHGSLWGGSLVPSKEWLAAPELSELCHFVVYSPGSSEAFQLSHPQRPHDEKPRKPPKGRGTAVGLWSYLASGTFTETTARLTSARFRLNLQALSEDSSLVLDKGQSPAIHKDLLLFSEGFEAV